VLGFQLVPDMNPGLRDSAKDEHPAHDHAEAGDEHHRHGTQQDPDVDEHGGQFPNRPRLSCASRLGTGRSRFSALRCAGVGMSVSKAAAAFWRKPRSRTEVARDDARLMSHGCCLVAKPTRR